MPGARVLQVSIEGVRFVLFPQFEPSRGSIVE